MPNHYWEGIVVTTYTVGEAMSGTYTSVQVLCDNPSGEPEEWLTFKIGKADPRKGKKHKVTSIEGEGRSVTVWFGGRQSALTASLSLYRNLK